jgi:hypothetical protein
MVALWSRMLDHSFPPESKQETVQSLLSAHIALRLFFFIITLLLYREYIVTFMKMLAIDLS